MDDRSFEDVVQNCPKCQSSNSSRKELKFKVSYCGHSICESCFEVMFQRNEDNCVICGERLVKAKFRYRKNDSDEVESYLSYYQDVKRIYNCGREDFENVAEYNDYLEEVERLIGDLMEKSTRERARSKMNEYHNANRAAIKARRNRRDPEFEEYERIERESEERRLNSDTRMRREKAARAKVDEEYSDRLVNGAEPLEAIIREYSSKMRRESVVPAPHGDASPSVQRPAAEAVPFRYERPAYMRHEPFSYRKKAEDGILYAVLLQALPDHRSIRGGGGYSAPFWFHRLRHFCE